MKSDYIVTNGVRLYVEYNHKAGDADAADETIIFAHGWPDYSGSWSHQMTEFSGDYNVAAFDLRGFHKSSPPSERSGYHIDKVIPDYEAVINFMAGPSGKVHLVGHDWGAILGWAFASRPEYAERLLSYTAISCPHPGIALETVKKRIANRNFESFSAIFHQALKSYYMFLFQLPAIPELILKSVPEVIWKRTHKTAGLPADDEVFEMSREDILSVTLNGLNLYREFFQGTKQPAPETKIKVPVSLIIALNDLALTPVAFEGTENYVENLEVHNVATNHWAHRENSELVNSILRNFWSRHRAAVK